MAIIGSASPEINGSGGILPFVKGKESFSKYFISSTLTVSITSNIKSCFPIEEKVCK